MRKRKGWRGKSDSQGIGGNEKREGGKDEHEKVEGEEKKADSEKIAHLSI